MELRDGPASNEFRPLTLHGNTTFDQLAGQPGLSPELTATLRDAPRGACVAWGIPFQVDQPVLLVDQPVEQNVPPVQARWLVFMHTADIRALQSGPAGFISPMRGAGLLNELAAIYIIRYIDGSQEQVEIRRRHQIGAFTRGWGENCFQAVAQHRPFPVRPPHEQPGKGWGFRQARVNQADEFDWTNWLWAWENPHPDKPITGLRFEPFNGAVILSAVSAGEVQTQPLRWRSRRKAVLKLPEGMAFQPDLDEQGLLTQLQLDLGQVISAIPRPLYPNDRWEDAYHNQVPQRLAQEVLVEYTCHPEASFHLWDGSRVPASLVEAANSGVVLRPVAPATQRVTLRVVDSTTRQPVAVKLHAHGEAGEYLAPVDRHRIINPAWFEDYSVDFSHRWNHPCTYISGETTLDLPAGRVYLEISKGFEIQPIRRVVEITPATQQIEIALEKRLDWRERGWVTADTHVHFLSPVSALLEGAAEGVNVVNLLASQWGELMTNVGDFDGKTTWGSREAGGDGEYLVRVGSENRQHVLGHISLLGYRGRLIAPMTTGGADESAIGDPVERLLTEWARQCQEQGGLVVLPHFPNPRAEHAASIISGWIDAVEMTSWGDLYSGIDPYSLSDWYRYLNCGYLLAAVGGTDKMSASTAVGTVRTYARLAPYQPFTYDGWMESVRSAHTFVTYGPLLQFSVEGKPMGSRIALPPGGGSVFIDWEAASVTVPMSRIELVVSGEIRESVAVDAQYARGGWTLRADKSCWAALLIRGHYPDQPEIIAAHSSPVMLDVEGSQMLAAADAVTILEQIEGALAYLDTVGTRADDRAWKRMRLELESAHRRLHNRLHERGFFHDHSPVNDHSEHHS